jgi:hypothetical protein
MATPFPDIMGEYINNPERFETDNIQYGGQFDPETIAPGEATALYLFLQNTVDAPVKINIQIQIPKTGGLFRGGKPILQIGDSNLQVEMGPAAAGLLTVPVATTEHTKAGQHAMTLELKAKTTGKGERVRPTKSQSKLDQKLIDNPVGLNLVGALGATFVTKAAKKAMFTLNIEGAGQALPQPSQLQHVYQTMWEKEQLQLFNQAHHELSLRQTKLQEELSAESLYVALYSESVNRFADAGMPLRIGEAIIMAKILTYSCQFFLSSPARRNGLLVPIWERALDGGVDTANALQVIRGAGFNHILRLSIALSFGLVAQATGRQAWSLEERQAVIHHIADNIEIGETTDEDFLYLPLVMGGTLIANKLILHGEDLNHTLILLQKAFQSRPNLFTDEEMNQAKKIYNHILQKILQTTS